MFLYIKSLQVRTSVSLTILIWTGGSNKISLHVIAVMITWVCHHKVLSTGSDTYKISINMNSSLWWHITHSTNINCYFSSPILDVEHSKGILLYQISHLYSLSPRHKSSQEMLPCFRRLEAFPWSQWRLHLQGRNLGYPQKLRRNQCPSRLR